MIAGGPEKGKSVAATNNTQVFAFDGHLIEFRREGSGRPMILFPNAFTSYHLWDHQVDRFRKTNDVIALNPLGVVSADISAEFPLVLYVRLLDRCVAELDVSPVILMGNCIGSLACLHYASQHPKEVSALILINVHTRAANAAGAMGALTETALRFTEARDIPAGYMRGLSVRDLDDFPYIAQQFGDAVDDDYRAHMKEVFSDPAVRLSLLSLSYSLDTYVLPDPDRMRVLPPVCWIWGEKNRIFPIEQGEAMAAVVNPTEVHVVQGAGHALARERPNELNDIIEGFLARRVRPTTVGIRDLRHAELVGGR